MRSARSAPSSSSPSGRRRRESFFPAHYFRADGNGGIAIVEADTAVAAAEALLSLLLLRALPAHGGR
jgi:hypothetical protein